MRLIFILIFLLPFLSLSQVNSVTVIPQFPTPTDTIYVITDLTYQGSCSDGLIFSNVHVIDSLILIIPIYCGFGLTTVCNSVDTFIIEPLPEGIYYLDINYNQYSICPISSFETTIAQYDSFLVVNVNPAVEKLNSEYHLNIFPNPAGNIFYVEAGNDLIAFPLNVEVYNSSGKLIKEFSLPKPPGEINLTGQLPGIYFLKILTTENKIINIKKVVLY